MVKKAQAEAAAAAAPKQQGLIEGSGVFQCFRHEFETRSIAEWNDHCSDGDHFEMGSTMCIGCGEVIEFTDLPFVPFKPDGSKGITLQCDDCSEKTRGSAKITKRAKTE